MVAESLNIDSFSIDASPKYNELAQKRLDDENEKWIDEQIKQAKRAARESVK